MESMEGGERGEVRRKRVRRWGWVRWPGCSNPAAPSTIAILRSPSLPHPSSPLDRASGAGLGGVEDVGAGEGRVATTTTR